MKHSYFFKPILNHSSNFYKQKDTYRFTAKALFYGCSFELNYKDFAFN